MTQADDLQRLVERIEGEMDRDLGGALSCVSPERRAHYRSATAEWAVIALALRARINQEKSNG